MAIIINNATLPIQTVAPTLSIGEIQLSADRRSGKDEKLTDAERIRRVVLPAGTWGTIAASKDGETISGLTDILREALKELGSKRLRDMLAETPMLREVAVSSFTVAELLKWSEETASSRGSITFTREAAEKWFLESATRKALLAKWEAAGDSAAAIKTKAAFVSNRIGALAAKNHGIATAADAEKLLSLIDVADVETGIGTDIVGRIDHIIKQLTAKEAEATVSMDSL